MGSFRITRIGLGLGYTTMIIFAGNALAFWFGMTLRYNDEVNPATGRPWEPGNILAIFFCATWMENAGRIFIFPLEIPSLG